MGYRRYTLSSRRWTWIDRATEKLEVPIPITYSLWSTRCVSYNTSTQPVPHHSRTQRTPVLQLFPPHLLVWTQHQYITTETLYKTYIREENDVVKLPTRLMSPHKTHKLSEGSRMCRGSSVLESEVTETDEFDTVTDGKLFTWPYKMVCTVCSGKSWCRKKTSITRNDI